MREKREAAKRLQREREKELRRSTDWEFPSNKQCSKCGRSLPVNAFNRDAGNKDGLAPYCRECFLERQRKHTYAKKYGLTVAEYDELLERQKGQCAVCGRTREDAGRFLAVDHCHNTGNVRGLLCQECNLALGYMRESPELLRRAADYLEAAMDGNLH